MSEHQKHTEFLKQCILYDDSSERHRLEQKVAGTQRDLRCVQRAMWLMALLTLLAVAGLGYEDVLMVNFPYDTPTSAISTICALGVGSLISFLAFAGLGMIYTRKLDQRREECRQLVTRLLESRLGKPIADPLRDIRNNRVGGENVSAIKIESAAQG